jgi:precorrin-3B methylase
MIFKRLEAVAAADMVVSLYNPRSKKRVMQLEEAVRIFRQHRPGTTPAGVATAVGADDEELVLTDLDHLLEQEIGMRSIVIVGNLSTRILNGRMVTPRGYYK